MTAVDIFIVICFAVIGLAFVALCLAWIHAAGWNACVRHHQEEQRKRPDGRIWFWTVKR